ncbi:RHS repeat domain-containing protein [Flavobacterium chilense]|nr:RHS repeat domain-containing protein [Flavobacterium chilense]
MQYLQQSDKWVVVDGLGYSYYFNTRERTQDYYRTLDGGDIPNDSQIGTFDNYEITGNPLITSSWYLDSIVAPNGEAVNFIYQTQLRQSVSLTSKSETEYDMEQMDLAHASTAVTPSFAGVYHRYNASKQVILDVYLKQINFSGGIILFNTTDRDDIEYLGTQKPQKLSQIVIKDLNNNTIKKYNFNYSYFLSNTSSALSNDYTNKRRLKLDSVIETGTDNQQKPPYAFDYYNADDLPYKYTKAIDHWGYYNKQTNNNTILPGKVLPSIGKSWKGADRSANQTDTDMIKGMLSSIKYPTGGASKFNYELNEYGNLKGDDQYVLQPQSVIASSMLGKYSEAFDIAVIDTTVVTLKGTFKKSGDLMYIGDYAHFYKNGNLVYQFQETASQPSGQYSNPQTLDLILYPGHYTMDIINIEGITCSISANWNKKMIVAQKKGGGLRISKITNYSNNQIVGVKKFLYKNTNGSTTGKLIAPPLYDFQIYATEYNRHTNDTHPGGQAGSDGSMGYVNYIYRVRMSNSITVPSLLQNSGIVGYDKVTELDGENGENGKTEYYYHNIEDRKPFAQNVPYLPLIHDPMNGKMDKVVYYTALGDSIKKIEYQYTLKGTKYLKGLTKLMVYPEAIRPNGSPHTVDMSGLRFYNIPSYWIVPSSETETSFYKNQNPITVLKKSNYDNYTHLNLTSSELTLSDGNKKITKYSYAQDSEMSSLPFISEMVANNMISIPLKTQTFNENTKLSEELTVYDKSAATSNLLLPRYVYANKGTNDIDTSLDKKITFDHNDTRGNVQQYTPEKGSPVSIIWGYNKTQPIAKIENATNTQVAVALGLSDVNSLDENNLATINNLRDTLPDAMVTTYTYIPLVGVSTITDPKGDTITYTYDSFGRLQFVKDKNGNILSENEYHYQTN